MRRRRSGHGNGRGATLVARAFESLQNRRRNGEIEEPEVAKTDEVLLLEQIRDLLAEQQA